MLKLFRRLPASWLLVGVVLTLASASCGRSADPVLRLATTTSTYDSGLLDEILPDFEDRFGTRVEVVAVGTGQALGLGERGDVDIVMVHDPIQEEAFVEAGHGIERTVLMYNDFILVGPAADPAGVNGLSSAAQAFQQIAVNGSYFASRGDQSGTYAAEQRIWAQAGLHPDPEESWYLSLGQGMGATLQFADERGAYTLSDRGTYLASTENLDDLIVMVGGASFYENIDDLLMNCYSVIAVNPSEFPGVDYDLARSFTMWISDPETKARIARFGIERFGQPLFYPVEADGSKPIQSPGQQAP